MNDRGVRTSVRDATRADAEHIRRIWNEGIADRVATLDEDAKTPADVDAWFDAHLARYAILVAALPDGRIAGWASLNVYSHRCAYDGVAELSVYVERASRGTGIGTHLLSELEERARTNAFHKIVLFALAGNMAGSALYRTCGFREVGTFRRHGRLDGVPMDVVAMEKLLPSTERSD